jgi:hypothetical protein
VAHKLLWTRDDAPRILLSLTCRGGGAKAQLPLLKSFSSNQQALPPFLYAPAAGHLPRGGVAYAQMPLNIHAAHLPHGVANAPMPLNKFSTKQQQRSFHALATNLPRGTTNARMPLVRFHSQGKPKAHASSGPHLRSDDYFRRVLDSLPPNRSLGKQRKTFIKILFISVPSFSKLPVVLYIL